MTEMRRKPARRPRRRARGALAVIGGLLLASAILRIATGAGEALAREEPLPAAAPPSESAQQAPGASGPSLSEADIAPVLEAMQQRKARLDQRETAIDVRMQALRVAEEEIERRLAELERAENSLRETLALAKTAAEDDLNRLTDVYANMKPKQAAALFEEMDPRFAAGFLGRMRPDAAASIMAGLSPPKAYTISVVLAGRNADVPTE